MIVPILLSTPSANPREGVPAEVNDGRWVRPPGVKEKTKLSNAVFFLAVHSVSRQHCGTRFRQESNGASKMPEIFSIRLFDKRRFGFPRGPEGIVGVVLCSAKARKCDYCFFLEFSASHMQLAHTSPRPERQTTTEVLSDGDKIVPVVVNDARKGFVFFQQTIDKKLPCSREFQVKSTRLYPTTCGGT